MLSSCSADVIVHSLRERGYSVNPPRMAVLRALAAADGPAHADQLLASARCFHRVSRATVSRTLSFLRAMGIADLVLRDEGRAFYVIVPDACGAGREDMVGQREACFSAPSRTREASVEPFVAMLRAGGYMVNPERAAILRTFVRANGPVTTEQMLAETCRHFMVSRATVSRTLKLFHEVGIAKVAMRDRKRSYYSLASGDPGIVLVDEASGSVRSIAADGALEALHLTLAQEGFALSDGVELRVRPLQRREGAEHAGVNGFRQGA